MVLKSTMVEHGLEVHLLAFADDPADPRHHAALESLCASARIVPLPRPRSTVGALVSLAAGAPFSLGYFSLPRMRRLLRCALPALQPDVIFVSGSVMAQYLPNDHAHRAIVDLVDVDSEKWRQYAGLTRPPRSWLYALESVRLRRYELTTLRRVAASLVTTEREAALLRAAAGPLLSTRLHVIGNGVDLDWCLPSPTPAANRPAASGNPAWLADRGLPRLVFVGEMSYFPNVDAVCSFADQVFPSIRRQQPRAELLIVGRNPTAPVRRLGRRPGIRVVGPVPDVRPYLAAATVCVVPLRIARGVQNKVLEAMACGRPIVATPEAVAGLQVRDGVELRLARTADELAQASLRLLQDASLRINLGAEARRYVEREHQWSAHSARLLALLEATAAQPAVFTRQTS
jgi:sugar transferase (PEP-CTERM/EpsH1 system associated)